MNRLIQAFKVIAAIELLLLAYVLLTLVIYIFKETTDYIGMFVILILFLAPIVIGLKVISFTKKNARATDTLLYTGHIFNFIKLFPFLLIVVGQFYFFSTTIDHVSIFNERGLMYYTLLLATFLLIITSTMTFITYFGIAKENIKNFKKIIQSIDKLKS